MARKLVSKKRLSLLLALVLIFSFVIPFPSSAGYAKGRSSEQVKLLAAPANLAVSGTTSTSIGLTWDAVVGSSDSDVSYKVSLVEQTNSSVTDVVYTFDSGGLTEYTVKGLASERSYIFTVQAVNLSGPVSKTSLPLIASTLPAEAQSPTTKEEELPLADQEPPSTPELSLTGRTSDSISLAWSSSEDNVGVAEYVLYQDSNLLAEVTVSTTVYTAVNLKAGQEYTFFVQAIDETGNKSAISNELKVSTLDDVSVVGPVMSMGNGNSFHTLTVQPDGTVWAWGNNRKGQLGDSTTITRNKPVRIVGLPEISAASVGQDHSIALATDGTVWTWGGNNVGQLGNGTLEFQLMPQQVPGLARVVAVQAGEQHSLALLSDGTVWAWGLNAYGQLGDGTIEDSALPVQVIGLESIVSISAGAFHNLAVSRDGQVYAWGFNAYGQLGDNTKIDRATPVQVAELSGVASVSAGFYHSMAVKKDGNVWSWGTNAKGILGDGTTEDHYTPVQTVDLGSVISVSAGALHSIALKRDGTVWTWGANNEGQLGGGAESERSIASMLNFGSRIVAISAGYMSGGAVNEEGALLTWGYNGLAQLGDGTYTNVIAPVTISLLEETN
jgi:alpha-tubulin suppressor-like RCC1 family protein